MTVGSLFAGIGGFDLGFERAGFDIKWQVEIEPYAQRVLGKHWPNVDRFDDVRASGLIPRRNWLEPVDVLCGGFPCQDISVAGAGAGIDGERSGLWREYVRLIRELRPRYVVVENVSALLSRGLGRVLGDLAASGFDAEWDCVPASALRAPHQRDRVWIVAYPNDRRELQPQGLKQDERRRTRDSREAMADASGGTRQRRTSRIFGHVALGHQIGTSEQWRVEPNVGRVAHGIPARVDRLRGLGNAVVPQITEWIARRILKAEALNHVD